MYEKGRRNPRMNRSRRSRERAPPRQRSPELTTTRDRSRPKFERRLSHERSSRRSRDRPSRFSRGSPIGRGITPEKLIDDSARFEPPLQEVLELSKTFENDRYNATPRFEDRAPIVEPPMMEQNLNFECPVDYNLFPGDGRYFEHRAVGAIEPGRSAVLESAPAYASASFTAKLESNDKPDPWSISHAPTGLQLTFGQEKGSNLIPEFDPQTSNITINAFLRLIEKVGQDKGWSGNDKKFQFSTKLKGAAKEWFVSGNKFLDSWSSIKRQFKSSFPDDMEYHFELTNMLQRTKCPDEDLSSYFNYKIALLRNCGINGKKAVSCLIGGLPESLSDLKTQAFDQNLATAEELYKFLMDQNVEQVDHQTSNPKCIICGRRDPCDCHKPKQLQKDSALGIPIKCYKDVYISGKKLRCLIDPDFPNNTIRETDIDFLKLRYRRVVSTIDGYERSTITALGQAQIMVRIDNLFTEIPFYVVRNNMQDAPVILGSSCLEFPHTTNRNTIFFTSDDTFQNRPELVEDHKLELKKSRSPSRRNQDRLMHRGSPHRIMNRSPRRSPPGHSYKGPPMFLNTFYDNPYA